jgi:putative Holliday junction resolvase
LQIPIHFQDERLTSFAADEKLSRTELTRKKKKKRLDAIAAAEILEAFLEQKNA